MPTKIQFKTNIAERYENGESSRQISKDEGCNYNSVLRELKRRGVNIRGLWTEEEIEKLKRFYATTSNIELLGVFPKRKKENINNMAYKIGLKKKECKEICGGCGKEFMAKQKHGRWFCIRCIQRQWEYENPKNGDIRKKQWSERNPEYLKQYIRRPDVKKRVCAYFKKLRNENSKFRLDCNMGIAIYQALKDKKAGRRWEGLVGYTIQDLVGHLEKQFDKNMTWKNYGSYWHVDHKKPRSLFKYSFSEDLEFKECWSLENLQPLERIANIRKSNTFVFFPSKL